MNCPKCNSNMRAENEFMSGFSFQTKVWVCTKCNYHKNLTTKKEFSDWESKFAEQMKNDKKDKNGKYNKGFECLKKGNDRNYIGKKFKPEKHECCGSGNCEETEGGCGDCCGGRGH